MSNQEDGFYPRLNGAHLASGQFGGMIVSVVGTVEACDGQHATVKCCDGGQARFQVDPSFAHPPGTILELIGVATEGNEAQLFVARDMSPDFDMEVYNKMITEVQHNPKFSEYFTPAQ
eukprot:CAMPEP_0197725748 /NCGR_PEP_ID=MMETSP1434-20131217/10194_1 /TAXON_ID=265543 /ORGANISM="Minutocellus polymorphus, Strain CCMP3303" /LENGTH=117 /DNA_ID=CAMNT_0043311387 /DNA_START=41 /DNA_END=394 /DNA_ORIENTATION=+